MFKSIDEVIDFYFKEWRNLSEEHLVKNTRKLWLLIGELNAFINNNDYTWNRIVQEYEKTSERKFSFYTFQYVNEEVVLISPSGTIKIIPEINKCLFVIDVDYAIEHKTSETTANEAISDLILKTYW